MSPTKKQHYVPRMLLKRFTTFQVPMAEPLIYQYDKKQNIERMVRIRNVCHEKNLYEIHNEKDKILEEERNLIEKNFAVLEMKWNEIIDKVENYETLNQNERTFLQLLIVLQLMRMPEIVKLEKEWLYDTLKNSDKPLTKNQSDRYAKLATFIWGQTTAEANWMLDLMIKKISQGKNLIIYHSNSNFILNGDRPVLALGIDKDSPIEDYQWFLPISKHYCLGLVNKNNDSLYKEVTDDFVKWLDEQIFQNDGRFIYGCESIYKSRLIR